MNDHDQLTSTVNNNSTLPDIQNNKLIESYQDNKYLIQHSQDLQVQLNSTNITNKLLMNQLHELTGELEEWRSYNIIQNEN